MWWRCAKPRQSGRASAGSRCSWPPSGDTRRRGRASSGPGEPILVMLCRDGYMRPARQVQACHVADADAGSHQRPPSSRRLPTTPPRPAPQTRTSGTLGRPLFDAASPRLRKRRRATAAPAHLLVPEQCGVDVVHAGSQVHMWQACQLRQQPLRGVAPQACSTGGRHGGLKSRGARRQQADLRPPSSPHTHTILGSDACRTRPINVVQQDVETASVAAQQVQQVFWRAAAVVGSLALLHRRDRPLQHLQAAGAGRQARAAT